MSETYELIGKDHEGNDIKEELELPTPDAALKKSSPDYHFELVHGKFIIIYGDVSRHHALSGTYIGILNSLSDVKRLEEALEYAEDDCYINGWTCVFAHGSTTDIKREKKSFDDSWSLIEHAMSFFNPHPEPHA